MALTKTNLANIVEGILPVANGGTGTSTGVAPGGSTTQVQYNNAGAFGGDSGFVYTGGNVGIGTASPAQKFHISAASGSVYQQISSGANNIYFGYVSADAAASIQSNGAITFLSGGSYSERMRIDSSGNVGIGTSSPSQKLDVKGNQRLIGDSAYILWRDTADSASSGVIQFPAAAAATIGTYVNQAMLFQTNNAERMRITSAGGISFGSSGTAYGSSGQVLTSNGNAAPTWNSPAASGVTSVATGNGLSGGTITSSGTLVIACPSFNSVGSYVFVCMLTTSGSVLTNGSNYAAGQGVDQVAAGIIFADGGPSFVQNNSVTSGTWKWMAANKTSGQGGTQLIAGLACRVS